MITLAEAQASRAIRIAGACPTSQDWINLLNDATRELLKRGDFYGSIQFNSVCVYGDVVTWNRRVGTVLAVDSNCRSTIPQNFWNDWVPPGDDQIRDRWRFWHRHGCGTVITSQLGQSPVFHQLNPNEPQYIQIFVSNQLDCGKTITLYGINDQNQPVITRRPDGTTQPGEQIVLGIPYSISKVMYRRIDRVYINPATVGLLNVFTFDPVLLQNLPVAVYEPGEVSPMYQQSRVPNNRRCCGTPMMVSAMVKVQYVPVQYPSDLVQIDNLDALALAMQSVKHSDAYDHAGAEAAMARAVRDANYQLRDKFPLEQTTVSFRPFGTATLNRLYLGMR